MHTARYRSLERITYSIPPTVAMAARKYTLLILGSEIMIAADQTKRWGILENSTLAQSQEKRKENEESTRPETSGMRETMAYYIARIYGYRTPCTHEIQLHDPHPLAGCPEQPGAPQRAAGYKVPYIRVCRQALTASASTSANILRPK